MALTKISGNVVQQNNFTLSGVVTATSFSGPLTGNVTGNVTGNATGLSGTPNLNVGIVTATSFKGDGSSLAGIVTSKNLTIGRRTTSATISVVGTGMTISLRSGVGTVNF